MPQSGEELDPASLAHLPGSALIKRINALAEEAGAIVVREGLSLGPPDAVLKEAAQAGIDQAAQDQMAGIFAEIEALKTLLARRRAGRHRFTENKDSP